MVSQIVWIKYIITWDVTMTDAAKEYLPGSQARRIHQKAGRDPQLADGPSLLSGT